MNIHDIYINYLKYKNEEHAEARNDGKFHASSAGSCYRKQMYRLEEYPQDSMDESSYKVLRLGTIVHKDFENAIKYHLESNEYLLPNFSVLYSEHKVNLDNCKQIGEIIDLISVHTDAIQGIKEDLKND